jgi:hypothetical protein
MLGNPNDPNEERIYPTDRQVVDVMNAADGENEQAVIDCILYLYNERGLRPNTQNGPVYFAWFATVVQDHFDRRKARNDAANPSGYEAWKDRNDTKDWKGD